MHVNNHLSRIQSKLSPLSTTSLNLTSRPFGAKLSKSKQASMTTSIYLSQLDALAKKVESFAQSLHCAKLYSSREQYTLFETFSLRLADAAESVPLAIKALKKLQRENNRQSRKLLLEAQSDIGDLVTTTNLKNRRAFVRNIKLLFTGPQISALDSDTTKGRKRLTQERCERICSLSPDGLISWAVAFVPSQWTANLMSNDTFDCLEEQIEPLATVMWPSEVYDVLDTLGEEEPLRPLQKYHEFLKGESYFSRQARS